MRSPNRARGKAIAIAPRLALDASGRLDQPRPRRNPLPSSNEREIPMTEGLPPGPEETDTAIKPVQDELFRALFACGRANEELRADVTVIALVDFAAQVAIASGMLWQDYPAPAHSNFSAALHDFANQLEEQ